MRVLLEEARAHARAIGDTEGERIEAEIKTTLREVNRLMFDLATSCASGRHTYRLTCRSRVAPTLGLPV